MSKIGWALGALLFASSIAGCSGASGSAATNAAAANASGTPASGTPGARAGRRPGAAGTVQSISGSTVTLKGLQDNASETVELSANTTIRKQVTKAITDLQPGTRILALGQQSGNVLDARQIQVVGAGQSPSNGVPRPNGGAGRNGGNGGNGRPAGTAVNGTVDSVSGSTIAVKKSDGSTVSVILASGGQIVEEATGTASDIKPGEFLTATGQQQGNALAATSVSLSNQAPRLGGPATVAP